MTEAILLSREKMQAGEGGPFGAVVVRGGVIIARGWNAVTSSNDPTAHAEIMAIREACHALGTFHLEDCDIYASCEPCPMCLSAIYWARLRKLYYAATRDDAAKGGFDDAVIYEQLALPPPARDLPSEQLLHQQAQAAFEEWKRKANKVPY